jgi:hypothetical protein
MAIILDADVLTRGEKGTFDLKTWVTSRANDRFEIAAITVAELWHGVERTPTRSCASAEKVLGRVIELERDTTLAGQAYLALARIHRKLGKTEQATKEIQEFRRIRSLGGAQLPAKP